MTRLEEAMAAYQSALEESSRDRVPLEWTRGQNALGEGLAALGERETGTDRLEQALLAIRQAREVFVDEAGMQHRAEEFDSRIAEIEALIDDRQGAAG